MKNFGLFAAGVLFGTAGIKVLSSKDAKKVYTHTTAAGTAKEAINELRAQGKKVGQIKVRSFRPFPSEDICEALKNVKAFAVMDKDDSFNAHCGPMFAEVTASLYAAGISGPKGINYIYGLGGRDVRVESIQHVFAELEKIAATGEVGETYRYLDVRE